MALTKNISKHNLDIIRNRLNMNNSYAAMGLDIASRIHKSLWEDVSKFVDSGDLSFEHDTYNLRNGIASGLYNNGKLEKLYTFEERGTDKLFKYKGENKELNYGILQGLISTIFNMPYAMPGIYIVYRCVTEYGFFVEHGLGPSALASGGNVNKRGFGWWSKELVPFITKKYNEIKNAIGY